MQQAVTTNSFRPRTPSRILEVERQAGSKQIPVEKSTPWSELCEEATCRIRALKSCRACGVSAYPAEWKHSPVLFCWERLSWIVLMGKLLHVMSKQTLEISRLVSLFIDKYFNTAKNIHYLSVNCWSFSKFFLYLKKKKKVYSKKLLVLIPWEGNFWSQVYKNKKLR